MNWSIEQMAGALVLILGAIGGGSMLRRRVSKDAVGVATDNAEGDYIGKAIADMTRSRDSWQKAAIDVGDLLSKCREERRGLEVTNDFQREQIIELHLTVRAMKDQMDSLHRKLVRAYPELAAILNSDFGKPDMEPRPSVPINLSEEKS